MNDFEQHLQRQTLREVPADWRAEILKSARAGGEIVAPQINIGKQERASLLIALRGWLWPHPGAWASLAAIWLFLFVMQHQINVEIQEEIALAGIEPPVTDVMVAMEQHRIAINQLLALNDFELPAMDRPKRLPVAPTNLPPLMLFTTWKKSQNERWKQVAQTCRFAAMSGRTSPTGFRHSFSVSG